MERTLVFAVRVSVAQTIFVASQRIAAFQRAGIVTMKTTAAMEATNLPMCVRILTERVMATSSRAATDAASATDGFAMETTIVMTGLTSTRLSDVVRSLQYIQYLRPHKPRSRSNICSSF